GCEFGFRPPAVGPPRDDVSIGEGNLNGRVAGDHAQSVFGKAQVRNNFWPQHARDIRSGGYATSGSDLFGDAAAADDIAAFENQCGQSGPCEVGGCSQTVMAAADYDGIINFGRRRRWHVVTLGYCTTIRAKYITASY